MKRNEFVKNSLVLLSASSIGLRRSLASTESPIQQEKSKYVVAIDPNFSSGSEDADDFSISVIEIFGDGEKGVLVREISSPTFTVKEKANLLRDILTSLNVVFIILDNAGGPRFLEEYNSLVGESEQISFVNDNLSDYDRLSGRIAYSQVFNKMGWVKESHEALEKDILRGSLKFAPRGVSKTQVQLRSIVKKFDSFGNFRVVLPEWLRENGMRKDSYTSLLLGNWGRRMYKVIRNK